MNKQAFEAAVRIHRPAMLVLAGRLCQEPEDAVQEAMTQAWIMGEASKPLMYRLTRFAAAKVRRLRSRTGITDAPKSAGVQSYEDWTDVRSGGDVTEAAVELRQVRDHIATLPKVQAGVLDMLSRGYTCTDIAEGEGRSIASVTMAASAGRRKLIELLG